MNKVSKALQETMLANCDAVVGPGKIQLHATQITGCVARNFLTYNASDLEVTGAVQADVICNKGIPSIRYRARVKVPGQNAAEKEVSLSLFTAEALEAEKLAHLNAWVEQMVR